MYVNYDIDYLKYLKTKKVIIFGCGKSGKEALVKMQKAGIPVEAFCDNDEKKQNQILSGRKVISFVKLCEINEPDLMIVICSSYEREIRRQLADKNIFNYISVSQIDFGGGKNIMTKPIFCGRKVWGNLAEK